MPSKTGKISYDIEKIIKNAVQSALEAGRIQAERTVVNAYKATERRLYALPTLQKKVEDARERLADLQSIGMPERSKDVIRFSRSGRRQSPDEILEALIQDTRASIAADEIEIETINKALDNIKNDQYYLVVSGRYFEGLSDEEIAKKIPCDERTARRHRGRLVRVLAVWLYGAGAV